MVEMLEFDRNFCQEDAAPGAV